MRLDRLLANLGYGSRKDAARLIADGRVTRSDGGPLAAAADVPHGVLRVDGQPLDPPPGSMIIMLNKPKGYTCSTRDPGRVVFELFPLRFRQRSPALSTIGRLDRDTTGLLLLTDDGSFLHRVIAPRSKVDKVYEAVLARPLTGTEADIFAAGTLMLESERTPLLPARLEPLGERRARLVLQEGRYHQVRRMFAAVGNHVEDLTRVRIGGLELEGLAEGEWRFLDRAEADRKVLGG